MNSSDRLLQIHPLITFSLCTIFGFREFETHPLSRKFTQPPLLRFSTTCTPFFGPTTHQSLSANVINGSPLISVCNVPPLQDVLMTLSGKTPTLFRHDLSGLHSKQADRLTISMNAMHKIPSKFVPKKFAMTAKVPNTKGTTKVGMQTHIGTQQAIYNVTICPGANLPYQVGSDNQSKLC